MCSQFVVLCRQLGLFTRAVVAIDGSKFKAVNNRDKNYTVAKVTGRMEQVNASIARYLRALDRADREESDIAEAKSVRLKEKIAGLRRQMHALKAHRATPKSFSASVPRRTTKPTGIIRQRQSTLMSADSRCRRVNSWLSCKRLFRAHPGKAGGAVVETTVDHTLMRGLEPHDR